MKTENVKFPERLEVRYEAHGDYRITDANDDISLALARDRAFIEELARRWNILSDCRKLVTAWQCRALEFRGMNKKQLSGAGISKEMRDYAVALYEDRADELERILSAMPCKHCGKPSGPTGLCAECFLKQDTGAGSILRPK